MGQDRGHRGADMRQPYRVGGANGEPMAHWLSISGDLPSPGGDPGTPAVPAGVFTAYRARFYFTLRLAPALTAYARREIFGKLVVSPVRFYF